jgi:hypothetical protein
MPKERPILFTEAMVRAILKGQKTQTRRIVKDIPAQPAPNCHPNKLAIHPEPYFDSYCSERKTRENPRAMSVDWCWWQVDDRQCLPTIKCPYGQPGDLLWVREAWCTGERLDEFNATEIAAKANDAGFKTGPYGPIWYFANYEYRKWSDRDLFDFGNPGRRRHARFMPRWASRLTLRITNIRVERLQSISKSDAIAEGIQNLGGDTERWGIPGEGYAQHPCRAYWLLWESINGVGSWDANPWVWVVEFKREETQ